MVFRNVVNTLLLLVVAAVSACKSGGGGSNQNSGPDATAPSVSSTSPSSGATGVAFGANVTVTFSESVDSDLIDTSTFIVTTTSGGTVVTGTVSVSGATVTFNPSADLQASTQYTATIIGDDVEDAAGNTMAANHNWSFMTGVSGGGGGGGGNAAEGTSSAPVDLTGKLPYQGSVDTNQSFYKITGLTPSTAYTLTLSNATDSSVYFASFRDAAFFDFGCDGGSCATQASATGEIYVEVSGYSTTSGATFTLGIGLTNATSVGIASMPVAGSVTGNTAAYVVMGLDAAKSYEVTYSTPDATLWANVSLGSFVSEECWLITFANQCVVSGVSTLGLFVDGMETVSSTAFTIDIQEIAVTSIAAASLPYSGAVGTGNGYYTLTGLTPNAIYTVTLSGLSDNADLYLYYYGDGFSYPVCMGLSSGTSSESCTFNADDQGRLNVTVDGSNTTSGTSFTLNATAGVTTTSLAKASLPYMGTMNGEGSSKYFGITGLTANTAYSVSLTGLTGDIDIGGVYSDALFSIMQCKSEGVGTADEICAVMSNASGELFIQLYQYDPGTLSYTLNVTP